MAGDLIIGSVDQHIIWSAAGWDAVVGNPGGIAGFNGLVLVEDLIVEPEPFGNLHLVSDTDLEHHTTISLVVKRGALPGSN